MTVNVRSQVLDVHEVLACSTRHLGFHAEASPGFGQARLSGHSVSPAERTWWNQGAHMMLDGQPPGSGVGTISILRSMPSLS